MLYANYNKKNSIQGVISVFSIIVVCIKAFQLSYRSRSCIPLSLRPDIRFTSLEPIKYHHGKFRQVSSRVQMSYTSTTASDDKDVVGEVE